MKKKVPQIKTDRQAEEFLAQDLSKLDFSQFKTARFEFEKKDNQINMRVPETVAGGGQGTGKGAWHPLYTIHSGDSRTGSCHLKITNAQGFRW